MRRARSVAVGGAIAAVALAGATLASQRAQATNPPTYSDVVLADSPIGYWRLGEETGTYADSTAGGHSGQTAYYYSSGGEFYRHVNGAVDNDDKAFASESAPSGYNLRPDGAYVSVDTGTDSRYQFGGSAPFSLEAWINPQERTESYSAGILGNFVMNLCGCWNIGYGIFVSYPATTVKFVRSANTNGGTIDTLESAPVTPNEWTHVVATFDGTTMKIFVNGQLSASKPAANTVTLYGSVVRIGLFNFDYGVTDYPGFFAGAIDDAAVYNSALTPTQISMHYDHKAIEPEDLAVEEISDVVEDPEAAVLPPEPDPVESSDPDAPNDGSLPMALKSGTRLTQRVSLTTADGVTASSNANAYTIRNADGVWTIYRKCFDSISNGIRYNVGPGYIARLIDSQGRTVVDDYVGRSVSNTGYGNEPNEPGYINSVNGGLGAFGWHHARGTAGSTPAGDDPTTVATEQLTGRSPKAIEGRMCSKAGSPGVYATASPDGVQYVNKDKRVLRFDVFLRDQHGATGYGPNNNAIARIRYRYVFLKSSVSVYMGVTTYAKVNTAGTPFVKEPKFAVVVGARGIRTTGNAAALGFREMSVYGARGTSLLKTITAGGPVGTSLDTDHVAGETRSRVRFDYATPGGGLACSDGPCLNVVMRALPTKVDDVVVTANPAVWEGAKLGLDRWAVTTSGLQAAYPRDTLGDDVVSFCGVTPNPTTDDLDHDGVYNDVEMSKVSSRATTNMDSRRQWELSGFKDAANDRYVQAFGFFHGWENQRGPHDCEPLQRAFGPQGQTWGAFASYSLGDGWLVRP